MKALDHSNIARYHSASRWLKGIYLAMEYMNGDNLTKLNTRKNSRDIPESVVTTIMHEAINGVAYLHDEDHVHGDIKPENIFLSEDGEVKIGGLVWPSMIA